MTPVPATLLLSDLDARRTFDAYNVLRRVARDLDTEAGAGAVAGAAARTRIVCAEERPRASASSAYGATERLRLDSDAHFIDDLGALARAAAGPLVVMPCSEALLERMLAAAAAGSLPPNVRALLPPRGSFARTVDKAALDDVARAAGVRAPAEIAPPWTHASLAARLPLVAKPRVGRGSTGVRHLLSAADVDAALPHLDDARDIVVERFAGGTVYGAFFLYEDGVCVAQYGHERIRTFPASGGVSTCAVRNDVAAALALGRAVLDTLRWNGLAMIEAMAVAEAPGSGPGGPGPGLGLGLVEINPRLWGSVLLDEFSGAFLLRNYVRRCLGLPLAPQQASSRPAVFRWAAGEALHAAQTRDPKALLASPLDDDTCWSGVTYARRRDAAAFLVRAATSRASIAKLKSKWWSR